MAGNPHGFIAPKTELELWRKRWGILIEELEPYFVTFKEWQEYRGEEKRLYQEG